MEKDQVQLRQFERFARERKPHVAAWAKELFKGTVDAPQIEKKVAVTLEADWKSMSKEEKQAYGEGVTSVTPFLKFVVECVKSKKSIGIYCYGEWRKQREEFKKKRKLEEKNRCGKCKGCKKLEELGDCKKCAYCLDQKRYGGGGVFGLFSKPK